MTERVSFHTDRPNLTVASSGLLALGKFDFRLKVHSEDLLAKAEELADRLIRYQAETGNKIMPGQSVTHGYWTITFVQAPDGVLDGWEFTVESNCEKLEPGVEFTLKCWKGQEDLCQAVGAAFVPPHASHWAFVSAGVLDGVVPIEGVRYPSQKPNTGWFLTTNLYSGDIQSLKRLHLFHITNVRPELIPLLGLPYGYRFQIKDNDCDCDVWFDSQAANRPVV